MVKVISGNLMKKIILMEMLIVKRWKVFWLFVTILLRVIKQSNILLIASLEIVYSSKLLKRRLSLLSLLDSFKFYFSIFLPIIPFSLYSFLPFHFINLFLIVIHLLSYVISSSLFSFLLFYFPVILLFFPPFLCTFLVSLHLFPPHFFSFLFIPHSFHLINLFLSVFHSLSFIISSLFLSLCLFTKIFSSTYHSQLECNWWKICTKSASLPVFNHYCVSYNLKNHFLGL